MEPGSSFGLTALAALVCVVLGFAAFVLWFFARLDRAQEEERAARSAGGDGDSDAAGSVE